MCTFSGGHDGAQSRQGVQAEEPREAQGRSGGVKADTAPTAEVKRVCVFGSRVFTFPHRSLILATLDAFSEDLDWAPDNTVLVNGSAAGVDALAKKWAEDMLIEVDRFPAEWGWGKGAGPIRNSEMVKSGIDFALGFKCMMNSPGTSDMRRKCLAANVDTVVVDLTGF
jgi:hypothetical protein